MCNWSQSDCEEDKLHEVCVWVWTIGPDLCEQVQVPCDTSARFDLDPCHSQGHATSGDNLCSWDGDTKHREGKGFACVRQVGREPFFNLSPRLRRRCIMCTLKLKSFTNKHLIHACVE